MDNEAKKEERWFTVPELQSAGIVIKRADIINQCIISVVAFNFIMQDPRFPMESHCGTGRDPFDSNRLMYLSNSCCVWYLRNIKKQ